MQVSFWFSDSPEDIFQPDALALACVRVPHSPGNRVGHQEQQLLQASGGVGGVGRTIVDRVLMGHGLAGAERSEGSSF